MKGALKNLSACPPSFPKDAGGSRVSSYPSMGQAALPGLSTQKFRVPEDQEPMPLALMQTMIHNADMTGTLRFPKSQSWEVVEPTSHTGARRRFIAG